MKLYQITYTDGSILYDIVSDNLRKTIDSTADTIEDVFEVYQDQGLVDTLDVAGDAEYPKTYSDLYLSSQATVTELITFSDDDTVATLRDKYPELFL